MINKYPKYGLSVWKTKIVFWCWKVIVKDWAFNICTRVCSLFFPQLLAFRIVTSLSSGLFSSNFTSLSTNLKTQDWLIYFTSQAKLIMITELQMWALNNYSSQILKLKPNSNTCNKELNQTYIKLRILFGLISTPESSHVPWATLVIVCHQ